MSDELRQALERTRDGYEDERQWLTFLLDAYTGAGGFQGSVRQPDASWWGAAATRYAPFNSAYSSRAETLPATYLDRFPREDQPKFRSRIEVAHYWNFVGPLTDLKLSYLLRKGFTYHEQPETLGEWREDIDGRGTSWDELRPLVALMTALWGWTPVLVDMDPAEEGMSRAQAREAGVGRPRAIPLTPGNLVDWSHDGKAFAWAKVRTDHVEQEAWNAKPVQVSEYRIWTPTDVTRYEVRREEGKDAHVVSHGTNVHSFGQVPIAIFRHARVPGDAVRGLPMHSGPSIGSKRLFNLLSELDELLRSQTFAVLVLAKEEGDGGEISLGVDNALPLDPEAKQKHYYMAPDGASVEAYEKRIEATIREGIYRPARVEFDRPSGQAVSGIARAYSFSQTNRAIADFAGEFARGEAWMDAIAHAGLGGSPGELESYDVQAPGDFDVEDLTTEIDNVTKALSLKLGETMGKRLKLRIVGHFDPDMPSDERATIEAELDAIAEEDAQARAAMLELGDSMRDPGDNDPPPDDDEEDEDTDE